MLTSFCWVPKGAMKPVPLHTTDSIEQVREKLRRLDPTADEEAEAQGMNMNAAPGEESDSDDDDQFAPGVAGGSDHILEQIESDNESDIDDTTFKDTDLVFVTTKADKNEPTFECFTYDEPMDNIFLHHDAPIAGYPLASCWLNDGESSMLALGTMMPFIELWPLDVIDAVDPITILGGCTNNRDNYRPKLKKSMLKEDSHQDAVLSVKWNVQAQHIMASGSADQTIKMWDLNTASCVGTYNEDEKVQTLAWHPQESNLLLSGAFDGMAILRDCRNPQEAAIRFAHNTIIEHVEFGNGGTCAVTSDTNGMIRAFDLRQDATALWELQAHEGECQFNVSRHMSHLMASGGMDGIVKLWDLSSSEPKELASRNLKTGHITSLEFHPNSPHILGAAGAKGKPLVYTVTADVPGMAELAGVPVAVPDSVPKSQQRLNSDGEPTRKPGPKKGSGMKPKFASKKGGMRR